MVQSMGMARFALMDLHDVFLSLPKAILGSAGEIERLTKLMEGLSTQSDATKRKLEAASSVKFVFNMAQNAPFEVKSLTDTFVKLKTGGIDPTNGSMQALVDSVAKFGGSSEELHRASIAIMQMAGKGVISMEELRQQLGEAVPSAMAAMAVGMKMSMAELNKAVGDGTVAATGAIKKMFAVMSVDNAGAAAAMMTTWSGMLERLKTQWEMWKLGVAGEGFADAAKGGLQELIDLMRSPEAASFGRRVGESLTEVTHNILDLARTIKEYWGEVKTGAELIAMAWVGSKMVDPMTKAGAALQGYYRSVTSGAANVRASLAMEAQGRRDLMIANATFLEQTIAQNEAAIASNQATANANRAIRARELSDLIAQNRAILGVYAARTAANNAAMAAALPSNSPAVAAVARGTATAAQDLEAQVLLRHADAARVDQAEITRRTAALQAENVAMAQERTSLVTNTAAMTTDSEARAIANAHLETSAARFRAQAVAVTEANAAMAMMRAAATSVGSALSSMIFSMGGLVTAIMAAAWAWNYFSEKAEKAAKDAKIAFDTKRRLEEGNFNEDTLSANERAVKARKDRIVELTEWKVVNKRNGFENSSMYKENSAELDKLLAEQDTYEKNLVDEQKKVAEKNGEASARAMVQGWSDGLTKSAAAVTEKTNEITKKYADLKLAHGGKLTKEEEDKQKEELFGTKTDYLQQSMKYWDDRAAELKSRIANAQKIIADAKSTKKQQAEAQQDLLKLNSSAPLVAEQRKNAGQQLLDLQAPNDILPGKGKKHETTDSVQRELASTGVTLDKLQSTLEAMNDKAIDIAALRAGVDSHIEAIIAGDKEKHVEQKHTSAERAALAQALEDKALLDELKKRYGGLAKERAAITDQFILANEKMLTGNFNLEGKTKEELQVDVLKETLKRMEQDTSVSKDTIAKYKTALEDAQAILNGQNYVKSVNSFGANKKSIESLQIGNIVNDKERLKAQQALETQALREKYDAQIRTATDANGMRKKLQEQYNAEELALAQKHVNEMKTPLEKLGEQWADVTKNMENATADWANKSMDAFVQMAMTGKFQFGDLVRSILADILKIQMQSQMRDGITGMVKAGGDWVMKNIVGGPKSSGAGAGGADAVANKGVELLGEKSKDAAEAIGTNLKDSATNAAMGIAEQLVGTTAKMSADQLATIAMTGLSAAAEAAAAALMSVAGSSAASSSGQWVEAGAAVANYLFADGGIMSSAGSLPLHKYAMGGIATTPQVAIFGEGRMNEAYVPLPDGRTIPVTLKGQMGGGGAQGAAPAVQVNVINQTSTPVNASQGTPRFDGQQMILDVVLTAASTPGAFRSGMKEAMK
jgi:tape measure domain-containing protein